MINTTILQKMNELLHNTRYIIINETYEAQHIRDNLAAKFDSKDKKYGMVFLYFIPDAELNDVYELIKDTQLNDDFLHQTFDTKCKFGFEIVDLTLRERMNGQSNKVMLDTWAFADWESNINKNRNSNITDTALFLSKQRLIGINEWRAQ